MHRDVTNCGSASVDCYYAQVVHSFSAHAMGPVVPVQAGASLAGKESSDAASTGSIEWGNFFSSSAVGVSPVSINCFNFRSASSTWPAGFSPSNVETTAPTLPAGGLY